MNQETKLKLLRVCDVSMSERTKLAELPKQLHLFMQGKKKMMPFSMLLNMPLQQFLLTSLRSKMVKDNKKCQESSEKITLQHFLIASGNFLHNYG